MDYDGGPGKNRFYRFPSYVRHDGNLLKLHGLPDAGKLCGGDKSPPTAGPPAFSGLSPRELAEALELLKWLDDMYWPATFANMPLLRELAYTPLQHKQFEAWQARIFDVRNENIFDQIVSSASFTGAGDADKHFADLLAASPLFAPAMIDMAHLGAMIGGSFLPGIEVGREAGIAKNWCLFHGAAKFFPSIRFKPATKNDEHNPGTLTKDLAVPWSEDFQACDEAFWPTSRPGRTTKDDRTLARHNWQITITDVIPHLGASFTADADAARADADADPSNTALEAAAVAAETAAAQFEVTFVKEYWKALGFIRRDGDEFIEQEQSWH